jgi:RNase H-like domain found in reverse transcriptase
MYLDDCIVYGTGTDEFCDRLEKLFIRFDEKHIFLKAIKCKLGMSEVEYVGKTVSKDGLRMSEKQIKGVTEFPKPVNNTQMRSFLGFVNYFRNHVPNHSNVVAPLHAMIDHSARKQAALSWTPVGTLAFERIKQLIAISPKLYFMHDTAPIVLMTDASDYGVGGYLYQTVANEK